MKIYLIEDKVSRRNDYGWTDEKLSTISDVCAIDNAYRLQELLSEILKDDSNIIIYHESFINSAHDVAREFVLSFESKLKNVNNPIVYFSGSKSYRKIDGKICYLPPQYLYSHLLAFVNHYRKGITNYNYLMFGDHPEIEQQLFENTRKQCDINFDKPAIPINKDVLFCTSSQRELRFMSPFKEAIIEANFDLNCDDEHLMVRFNQILATKYDVIFIPLCFGDVLSDYLGLRLAMIIRFSETLNQYTPVFIYGEASYEDFMSNECMSILCMPGVRYISSDFDSMTSSIETCHDITQEEYRMALKHINLHVPTDIGDNHSIANKWAIYRWSYALNHTDHEIDDIRKKVSTNLYFRYLLSQYPPNQISPIDINDLIIKKYSDQPSPRIMYIDDEADDGWLSLMKHVFCGINNIPESDFESFGDDLKDLTKEKQILYIMDSVKSWNPNIVILDFRLHPQDFNCKTITEISGFKILKEIKAYNRGIQVIIFSATNKIWNLQALQEAEANGFIIKELPENSVDPMFTSQTIDKFVSAISNSFQNTMLYQIWIDVVRLKGLISYLKRYDIIDESYCDQCITFLELAKESLFANTLNKKRSLANPVIQLFRILEITSKEWIYVPTKKKNKNGQQKPYFIDDQSNLIDFDPDHYIPLPHRILEQEPTMPQKICNIIYKLGAYSQSLGKKVHEIIYKRNRFIHSNRNEAVTFRYKDIEILLEIECKIFERQR